MQNGFIVFIILYFTDSLVIDELRHLLKDFLIGARNRTIARKVYKEQSLINRITLGFIKDYLKEFITDFRLFHFVYIAEMTSIIPQYVVLLISNINNLVYIIIAVKTILLLFVWMQSDSLRRSKYRKGK